MCTKNAYALSFFKYVEGVDFFDTYASVMNTKSFRILLAIYNNQIDYNIGMWNKHL